ncbi:hypothetical protein SLEP1_g48696 [Rubroshorea leprosula]|uniref:Glycosyltransferase n=1 Tax=Rubroshorea leprosula TaxID=152421 RepID=A0AAV5LWD6_9ROSI|nr:hypothetical protein SLEP1_g48696 [Rubroshorea leprosula]
MGSLRLEKPHAVCIPYPAQGHINPMLKLAKLLHHRGFHITFVNTEFNHKRLLKSRGSDSLNGLPSFRFDTIPDGLPPTDVDATQDIPSLCESTRRTCLAPFKELLCKLNDPSSDNPPVSCIVSDGVMSFTLDAAQELGLPEVLFWTTSACGFLGYLHFRHLIEQGYTPLKDESYLTNGYLDTHDRRNPDLDLLPCTTKPHSKKRPNCHMSFTSQPSLVAMEKRQGKEIEREVLEEEEDWVIEIKGLYFVRMGRKGKLLKDLPSFLRTTDPNFFMIDFILGETERAKRASAIVLNTFDALENGALSALSSMLPPVFAVGPLPLLLNQVHDNDLEQIGSNLWREEPECLRWLDSKEPNSVVYVNFGSITVMTSNQLIEFAWGLANSNQTFLWIIRPDLVVGDAAILLPEFVAKTKNRGLLSTWCAQEQVLSHPAIGGFLTHSGWNSTLESISAGVPMICWPFFAEQQTNCRFCCTEWEIGMEINSDVKRDEVERLVRELMEEEKGREMKKKALEWKRMAEAAAASPSGSSAMNLDKVINEVLLYP